MKTQIYKKSEDRIVYTANHPLILDDLSSELIEKYGDMIEDYELVVNNETEITDPQINNELTDAYEAIANLYELNLQLQSRLEVLENGI